MRARRTVRAPVVRAGLGVHSGRACHAEVAAAPLGHGVRVNGAPAHVAQVVGGIGATVLQTATGPIRMIEHLLAALAIAGIDDARITVAGGEIPVLDGSAAGWPVEALPHGGAISPLIVERTIEVAAFGGFVRVEPAAALTLDVSIALPTGAQRVEVADLSSLLTARTFGRLCDLPRLRAVGLALGASRVNTVVLDAPYLPWRWPDEPVRHKALDLIGDLMLLGRPLLGRVCAHRSSHRLHHRFVAAILDRQSAA